MIASPADEVTHDERIGARMSLGWRPPSMVVLALLAEACGCHRPSVVGEPRLASVSVEPTASAAGREVRLGQAFLFGGPADPSPVAAMERLQNELNADCAAAGTGPCVAGIVPLGSRPGPPTILGGPATTQANGLLLCPVIEPSADGRLRSAPGFQAFMNRLEGEAARGTVRVQHHYAWDVTPAPPPAVEKDADAVADADPQWALKQTNYPAAEKILRRRFPGEEPGQGVVIAHMDTGYTRNCHFYRDSSELGVHPEWGYDFYGCNRDPRDPLLAAILSARQPGHGTKTGCLLVGPHKAPKGCETATGFDRLQGMAPGAELVPIRVSDGILLGLPPSLKGLVQSLGGVDIDHRVKALATAIDHASRTNSFIGRVPSVISISLGGICAESAAEQKNNATLQREIAKAERKGIIVVAAAGQYPLPSFLRRLFVRGCPVSFPGSYPSVISVAASTPLGTPWKSSARGRAVTVTAPGYGVWRAETLADGTERMAKGDGTSFSTAITAGIAALWVQYHGRKHLWDTYGPALSSAFRYVLAHGGTRQPSQLCADLAGESYGPSICAHAKRTPWRPAEFGPGLLDAKGLLIAALPPRADVCKAERLRRATEEDWRLVCPEDWPPVL